MVETSEAVEASAVAVLATEAEVGDNPLDLVEEVDLHTAVAEEVEIEAAEEEVVAQEETQMPLFSSETLPTHALIES